MKVKLLKKIRKRFEIIRIDELSTNPTSAALIACYRNHGLPMFYVKDNEDSMDMWLWTHSYDRYTKTKEEALDLIKQRIHNLYFEQFKHKEGKSEKVWYK